MFILKSALGFLVLVLSAAAGFGLLWGIGWLLKTTGLLEQTQFHADDGAELIFVGGLTLAVVLAGIAIGILAFSIGNAILA